jgi:hypothetical protein
VITNLGAPGKPEDWSRRRSGSVGPQYADVATIAQAGKMRDVSGTTEKDERLRELRGLPQAGARAHVATRRAS